MIGSLISAGVGLAGSLIGGNKAAKAQKRVDALMNKQIGENEAWFNKRYGQDYTQTAEAQNMIRLAREEAANQMKAAEGKAVVMGATDESVALARENANKLIADTTANIAAQGTAYKRDIENQYLQRKDALTQNLIQSKQAQVNNIAQSTAQTSSAFGNLASGIVGLFKK